jgi:hypothetical protein
MKKRLVPTAVLCAALCAGAQSPLSLAYPLGMPDLAVTGASAAMGGSGTAAVEEYMGVSLNPANAAVGNRSVFSALISYDITNINDNGKTAEVSGYNPKLISLIIPAGRAGNLSFSMQKRYDANLNFYTKGETPLLPGDDGQTSVTLDVAELRRKGGLTAWQAGWAYRFSNGVGVGLIYERLFFRRDLRDTFSFTYKDDATGESYPKACTDTSVAAFANNGFRFGAQIPVHEKVTLGFAGEYPLPGNDNGTATVNGESSPFSATLPPSMSIGAAYAPDAHWLIVADASSTLWEFYENENDLQRPIQPNPERDLGISAGARYIPAVNTLSSKYWEKIRYSAGVRYATLPNNKTFDRAHEYAFSVGAGLPIPRDGGMVDIVASFGKRSDPGVSGYDESVVKLQLGLSGGRNWFQKDASNGY